MSVSRCLSSHPVRFLPIFPVCLLLVQWCGAGVQLIFAIVAVGRWFTQFRSPLVVNAGMLMGPLGLLVSAVGLSDRTKMVSPDGVFEVAALWYYTGVFFWFVLQPLILWAILTNPRGDPKASLAGIFLVRFQEVAWYPHTLHHCPTC